MGGAVYFRTDNQVKQLLELQRTDQVRFAAEEGPRIHTVVKSFGQYRIGYVVAVIFALGFVFLTAKPWDTLSISTPRNAPCSTCTRSSRREFSPGNSLDAVKADCVPSARGS